MTEKKIDFDAYEIPEPPVSIVDDIVSRAAGSLSAPPVRRSAWPLIAAGAVAVASAALVLFMITRSESDAERTRAASDDRYDASTDEARDPSKVPAERVDDGKLVRVLPSAAARANLLKAIQAARLKRLKAAPPAPAGPGPSAAGGGGQGSLDRETIRKAMGEIRPLLIECYEMAIEHDASFAGKVTAEFRIVGEPDVGGLVAEVELESDEGMVDISDDDEVSVSGEFAECMRETIMSLEVPAPVGGGEVTVRYPFIFRNAAADAEDKNKPTHGLPGQAASLLVQSRDAAKRGEWGKALRLSEKYLDSHRGDAEALMVAALAACNLKNKRLATAYIGKLSSPTRKGMARQICLRNGVEID